MAAAGGGAGGAMESGSDVHVVMLVQLTEYKGLLKLLVDIPLDVCFLFPSRISYIAWSARGRESRHVSRKTSHSSRRIT